MSALSLPESPVLPPELEKKIFQLAAHVHPLIIPQLMLVACRIKIWVQPLLYRVVLLTEGLQGAKGYPYPDSSRYLSIPPSTLRDGVRHLLIRYPPSDPIRYVLSCATNVENLYIASPVPAAILLPILSSMPLKRLHCSLGHLFPTGIHYTHPMFSCLTHLEIFSHTNTRDPKLYSGLALIPNLTHLAFNDGGFLPFSLLLDTCKSLRVLVLLIDGQPTPDLDSPELTEIRNDGALTGADYWSRAEDFIAKRRSGEIDALQSLMGEDESRNLPPFSSCSLV